MPQSTDRWWPYVVRQGDTLTRLAFRAGVSPDTIWSHPNNAALKELRKNGDILWPTDLIHLPPPTPPKWMSVNVGTTNQFVATIPTMTIRITLPEYASATYSADADGVTLTGGVDGSGNLELVVGVLTLRIEVQFTSPTGVVVLEIGHLDPTDTRSGIAQRLAYLGYAVTPDEDGHSVRRALALFQQANGLPPTGEIDADTTHALEEAHGY